MDNSLLSVPPASAPPAIDHRFTLLAHTICADQQIHNQELTLLNALAQQLGASAATQQAIQQVLDQNQETPVEQAARSIPTHQRRELLRQAIAIAYSDGHFAPSERQFVEQLGQIWGISETELERDLQLAQNAALSPTGKADSLSIAARLLQGAESLLSRSRLDKLTARAPERVAQRIEQLQREILLSGPQYDQAVQQCATIAAEDFVYADAALRHTARTLCDLSTGIQAAIAAVEHTVAAQGTRQTAQEVASQLEHTGQALTSEILRDLEQVKAALQAKRRSLNHFSIAVMGRTKAGKSTLHAVITGEGWEAIGVGRQRTTRYNRVYEWKHIRIIDTPGIGAPGGKTDEEIARSVVEEADVICYVVTDDSIQETEFAFLNVLKQKTKPLIVLLNIQENLREPRRLERFLRDPARRFAQDGPRGIGGHFNRIHRYAQEHYASDYLTIIPVMLLAAQMSREPNQPQAKRLFEASHVQDFLDAIRKSLIDHGVIRRSQTLLGSTVDSIETPRGWIAGEAASYHASAQRLEERRVALKAEIEQAAQAAQAQLRQQIQAAFQSAFDQVMPLAEERWDRDESSIQRGWKRELKRIKFQERLEAANEASRQAFQDAVQEAIEEVGTELELISRLESGGFSFDTQGNSVFDKDFVRLTGMALVAAGAVLAFVFPPLGLLGIAGGLVSWASSWFESRDQKRRKAVKRLAKSLTRQLDDQQHTVLHQAPEALASYCQSMGDAVDEYFTGLVQGIEAIAAELDGAQARLADAADTLNQAYAKRIVDWAADTYEPLTDAAIARDIHQVARSFGRHLQIHTTTALPLKKTPEQICQILQEQVTIRSEL